MITTVLLRLALISFALACVTSTALAQAPPKRLLERAPGQSALRASVAATRLALARVDAQALEFDRIEITFAFSSRLDDVQVTAQRTKSHSRAGSTVWFGKLEEPDRGEVTLVAVEGVLAGSVTANGRMFEIGFAGGGLHEVRELDPALFPAEGPPVEPYDLVSSSATTSVTSSTSAAGDAAGQIDVMVVWTPAARNAVGGTAAAIQSLVELAVANANASYANSQVSTSLRLVYSGEVNFAETPASISTDLSRLSGRSDGYIDQVHSLRDQHGADIVTLIGSGYADAGYCGMGYLMSSVSTSFAASAFNLVDQSCASGNLSYVHEVGHNQGLHHDPANAGSTPSYSYAYGYQDPSSAFRTVMSYGGAARVQQLSNPNVLYAGKPTGTSTQDNAQALSRTSATVANFRSSVSGTIAACSYTVTPTSMSFTVAGGAATVIVTTDPGCSWTTATGANWVTVGPGGSGPGSVVVTVAENNSGQRSATATVAGMSVSITEAGVTPTCTYTVTPTSVSFGASGGTGTLSVTTQAGCSWTTITGGSWVTVTSGNTGSGTVTVTSSSNVGGARSATLTIAGQPVTVTQAAAAVAPPPSCTYVLSSTALTVPSTGGAFQVQVTTTAGCSWTARSNTGWLKVKGGGTGAGPATLELNGTSGNARTATATIADQLVTITQLAGSKGK